jgi:sugar transferase (PEP-CTERM/EpsH1 system associated)
VHQVIALSRELEDYLLRRVGIAARKISRVYNGVDNTRFHPGAGTPLPDGFNGADRVVFGTVGRMHGVKDQINLCRAFVLLCQQQPQLASRLRLVLVGDGPLREPCARMLAGAGLDGHAWLPGNRTDVAALMRAFDVFVLPSQAEGISNTILEAMASALPVIATDVGGNGELVDPGNTGFLVPANDPQALAARMALYAGDATLRQAHGAAGCQRVADRFSMARMLSAYGGIYDRLMERRGVAH